VKFQSSPAQHSALNLLRALLISLLLHAIFLWQPPLFIPSGSTQSPAVFAVIPLKASLPARAEPQPLVSALPAKQAVNSSDVQTIPKPSAARQPVEAPVAQSAAMASATSQTLGVAETGINANGMRQYRLNLAAAARRFKVYPVQAMASGWSGTAEVAVVIGVDGLLLPVQLRNSSGHAVLDAAALEMVAGAALNTVVPDSLRGQRFSVALPVVFESEER